MHLLGDSTEFALPFVLLLGDFTKSFTSAFNDLSLPKVASMSLSGSESMLQQALLMGIRVATCLYV